MSTGARDIDTKAAREVLAALRDRASDPSQLVRLRGQYFCAEAESWLDEIDRLSGIITQHELCHDQHGKVNAEDFAESCAAEQRKIYGCAPHADRLVALTAHAAAVPAHTPTTPEPSADAIWRAAVQFIRDQYPADVFTGDSIDARSAALARKVCDNILAEVERRKADLTEQGEG